MSKLLIKCQINANTIYLQLAIENNYINRQLIDKKLLINSKQLKTKMESLISKKEISAKSKVMYVNDGSKDGSLKICNEYANKYSNIKLLNQENQGWPC